MKKIGSTILAALTGAVVGAGTVGKIGKDRLAEANAMSIKHLELFKMMAQWVQVKQEGKKLASYFESHGYKKIAIYGMSYAGETLLNELKDSGITVVYGIDKNAASIYADIKILPKIDSLEEVDAIVVTAITFFDEIEKMLAEETDCPVVSLEDVLFEV
ncbi:MAG: hypothetical protein HFH76_13865 [Lachnospiraceae bacterium]|nr:hypothetical protein [Lachnospiraceae bacterium]